MKNLRNLGIIAHVDAGKTTATERMLFYSGLTHKMGNVDEGNTMMDKDPQEMQRGITIHSAAITTYWDYREEKYQVNIIDTPGHVDFAAEVERSLRVLDGALALFCAKSGVEPQSESVWQQSNRYGVPRICFVNKMDREGADFLMVVEEIREELNANPIVLQLPVGEGKEFKGVIDLITEKFLVWDQENQGSTWQESAIPEAEIPKVQQWRQRLLEKISDHDLEFLDLYLNEDHVCSEEEIVAALRRTTLDLKIQPVLCGSAFKNIGVQPLLDAVIRYLPSPDDIPEITGIHPKTEAKKVRKTNLDEPLTGLVFKVVIDSHVGKMAFFRLYSGKLSVKEQVYNPRTEESLRTSRILRIRSDKFEPLESTEAGEICALIGLKDIQTGDTLCSKHDPILLEKMQFLEPVVGYAIEARTQKDEKRLEPILQRLLEEDPTLDLVLDEETNQTILRGMGELHLEVVLERLRSEFDLPVLTGKPRVSFKVALGKTISWKTTFERQTGGRNHFAEIHFDIGPGEKGTEGLTFINEVKDGNIPKMFIPSIKKGFASAMLTGPIGSHPMQNLMVRLKDGAIHDTDSQPLDFEVVAQMAFREASHEADPILLEPLMRIEIITKDIYTGAINGDLNRRGGVLEGIENRAGYQIIKAKAPLRNLFGYANDLRQISAGRARASMRLAGYVAAPKEVV
ncbi:MAG: elongation factor G [Bacteroidetes bacterium]|nr:elongation factor G [Bacteroidota bacterium]